MTKLKFFMFAFCSGACTFNALHHVGELLAVEPAIPTPFRVFTLAVFAVGFAWYAWTKKDKPKPKPQHLGMHFA